MNDFEDFLDSAKEIAFKAGEYVRLHLSMPHNVISKQKFDFVTETDHKSENIITSFLLRKYPDHLVFGEEAVSSQKETENELIKKLPDDKFIWIVDPIDGTTNFIRGIPQYAISIALVRNWQVIVGVVYDISRDEMFYSSKNTSSCCNGKEIHVSSSSTLDKSIIATSFPAADMHARNLVLKSLYDYGSEIMSLRIWNCATIAAVSLACGRIDAYVEPGIHLWDFSAGKIIIENAGGKFTDIYGKPYHKLQKHVLATNGYLHEKLLGFISEECP
jgi:myo-inositol-1(or 4)-monophosphatase